MPLRVLMVEDSEDDVKLLLRLLAKEGFEVAARRVDTRAAMQAALNDGPWDVILADHTMPEFSALAALDTLKRSGLDLPFIVVSGTIGEESAVETMKAGAHDYIMKDKLLRLVPAIKRELREATVRRERREADEALRLAYAELERRVEERTAELARANKELEAFSYSVSHDLRAPLRAIDGFSHILMEQYAAGLPAEARRCLEAVGDNARMMGQLVDSLLRFSRLSRQPLTREAIAPADLAREVLAELLPEHAGRRIEVSIGDLPGCLADRTLLQRVFTNLLANALKFTRTREVATIEVGCREEGGQAVYFVKDNGVGFDMRDVKQLFEPFQRLHPSEDYEGTGVGLAIVQRIIQRHGGSVWAEAAIGQGATFCFTL